jgi:hypothetical protein
MSRMRLNLVLALCLAEAECAGLTKTRTEGHADDPDGAPRYHGRPWAP